MHVNSIKARIIRNVYRFAFLIPRQKKLWVFGAWDGRLYADNPKYLFEYINRNHPEIQAIWITKESKVKKRIESNGYKCYLQFSIRGIIAAMRAEVSFMTSDERTDISPFVNRRRTIVVELWHGIAPKGMKWARNDDLQPVNDRYQQYYWMATSERYRDVFSKGLLVDANKFFITGYSRNDSFVVKPYNENMEELIRKHKGDRFVVYMPTHRNYGKTPIDISEFPIIDAKLREQHIVMLYKPHFNELKNLAVEDGQFTNILIARDQELWGDVYSYIHYFDLLISDYSSIVYDFLCADKPIVLYTYDLEDFRQNDFGLMDYFEEIPPGPFCYTWDETISQSVELLKNDTWKQKRNICRKMFHPFEDGKNSERIYEATKLILAEKRYR